MRTNSLRTVFRTARKVPATGGFRSPEIHLIPGNSPVKAIFSKAENQTVGIGSALSGMNAAAYQMLGAVKGVASGNLDNIVSSVQNMQMAKMQFEASAKVAEVQSQTTQAALDMFV